MDKIRQLMYYCVIGIVSLIALLFLPMIGSEIGLGWNIPNTTVGWIVWIVTKLIVATLNVLIFHCFMQQARLNSKNNEKYQEAQKILSSNEVRQVIPRSPTQWNKKQYKSKGVTIFVTTGLSTIALTQAILSFDWMSMLTYLFTIVMGLIFGVMQMKTAEEYWTDEYWQYAQMVKGQVELAKEECVEQTNDTSSDNSRNYILDTGVGSSDISDNSIGMVVDSNFSDYRFLGRSTDTCNTTSDSTDTVCEENI